MNVNLKEIKIITFNIQGTSIFDNGTYDRLGKISDLLSQNDADIINIQEVFTYYHLYILKKRLKRFHYCIFEKYIFGPKGGLITFSKLPIKKSGYIQYPSPKILKSFFLQKGVLISKIKNSTITILNTHLSANRDNDWRRSSRFYIIHENQIKRLQEIVKLIKGIQIISGDFNISKSSGLYKDLVRMLGVQDIFGGYNFPTFHQEFMSGNEKSNRIDYVLIKKIGRLKITEIKHIFVKKYLSEDINHGFLSDHVGLEASIKISS